MEDKEVKTRHSGKKRWAVVLALMITIAGIIGVYALYGATSLTKRNMFSIAVTAEEEPQKPDPTPVPEPDPKPTPDPKPEKNKPIEIIEPEWDEELADNLGPQEWAPKDPKVQSDCSYDGYIMVKVRIPLVYTKNSEKDDYRLNPIVYIGDGSSDKPDYDSYHWTLVARDDNADSYDYYFLYKGILKAYDGGVEHPATESVFSWITVPAYGYIKYDEGKNTAYGDVKVSAAILPCKVADAPENDVRKGTTEILYKALGGIR